MNIKAIVMDMDGTLLNSKDKISPKTAQNCMSTEKRSHRRRRQRMPSEKKARIWQTIYWENRAKSARSGWIRWICVKGCQLLPG